MAATRVRQKKALALLVIHFVTNRRRKRKITCWRKKWIARDDEQGAYDNLIGELELEGSLRDYLRSIPTAKRSRRGNAQ